MEIGDLFQKRFIGPRFILAMLIILGFILGKVDSITTGLILAFYFGSHVTQNK